MAKKIIVAVASLLLLALACSISYGQTLFWQGNANSVNAQLGGTGAKKWLFIPNDTLLPTNVNVQKHGMISFKSQTLYVYDSTLGRWKTVGIFDSSGYITQTELTDTLATVHLQRVTGATFDSTTAKVKASVFHGGNTASNDVIGNVYAPFIARVNMTNPSLFVTNGVSSTVAVDRTTSYVGGTVASLSALAIIDSNNTENWVANISEHPVVMGLAADINARTGATGTVPYVAGLYATISGKSTLLYDEAALVSLTFSGTTNATRRYGAKVSDLTGAFNNIGLYIANGNEAKSPLGNWGIYDSTGYAGGTVGEWRIGNPQNDLGAYKLQVTGAEITSGLDEYSSNIASTYTSRSKPDKNYVDSNISARIAAVPVLDTTSLSSRIDGKVSKATNDTITATKTFLIDGTKIPITFAGTFNTPATARSMSVSPSYAFTSTQSAAVSNILTQINVSSGNSANWSSSTPSTPLSSQFVIQASSTGTLSNIAGIRANITNQSAGASITNAYLIQATFSNSGNTIANMAGLAIPAFVGSVTNHTDILTGTSIPSGQWGLYVGSAKVNYLGTAATLINTTTDDATNKLQVNGSIKGTAIRSGASSWYSGAGSPESVVTGNVGDIYSRTDGGAGSTFYVKESGSGNTGWVAK